MTRTATFRSYFAANPGQVSMRMVYGLRGAKWVPSFLRTIASTYWFAYQTVAGSLAVVAILDRWTGTPHSLVAVSITFAVLQAVVAITCQTRVRCVPSPAGCWHR